MKNSVDMTREIKVLISQLSAFIKTVDQILNNSSAAETARYVFSGDDSTQMVNKADVVHGREILSELTTEYNDDNVVSESTDLSKSYGRYLTRLAAAAIQEYQAGTKGGDRKLRRIMLFISSYIPLYVLLIIKSFWNDARTKAVLF